VKAHPVAGFFKKFRDKVGQPLEHLLLKDPHSSQNGMEWHLARSMKIKSRFWQNRPEVGTRLVHAFLVLPSVTLDPTFS
jgi:hypothetical protein